MGLCAPPRLAGEIARLVGYKKVGAGGAKII